MKTLKKLLSLLIAIVLLAGFAAVADTELTYGGATTATTEVVLNLGEQPTSYTIVIPPTVTLDPTTGEGSVTITLKSGFVLTDVTSLNVRATSGYRQYSFTQGTGGGASTNHYAYMTLTNSENDTTLTCWLTPNDLTHTTNLISITNQTDNTSDKTKTIGFEVNDLPSYGKYTGSLTFTVTTA